MSAEIMQTNSQVPMAPQPGELMVMSAADVIARMTHIQKIREKLMKKDVHFGKPFGDSKKDTLLKPGAEMLCVAFGLAPKYQIQDLTSSDEIRYRVITELYSIGSGAFISSGVGEASTNEAKYKWRASVCDEEFTEAPENRKRILYKKEVTGVKRVKQIRAEPADIANTVLKMAKKRSSIDATLTATGASDMFEQDIEDLIANGVDVESLNSDGSHSPLFYVKDVSEKSGTKGGKSWTKFIIRTTDDQEFATFDKKVRDLALKLKASGQPCTIAFKETQYGKDIESFEAAQAPKPSAAKPEAHGETPSADNLHTNGAIIALFANTFKVKPTQLEEYVEKKREDWTDEDREKLKAVAANLSDPASGREMSDYFMP